MTVLFDFVILVLLAATVVYAFIVERRVRALMHALHELHPTVMAFSNAVDRTEDSVAMLKSNAKEAAEAANTNVNATSKAPQRPSENEVLQVPVKAELIKGFFESARGVKA